MRIEVEPDTTIFVGSNNSGKTSATRIFQLFLAPSREQRFSIYDFSVDCWSVFDNIGSSETPAIDSLPTIGLDLWFEAGGHDLHRLIDLLPSLEWANVPIGVRLRFAPKNGDELIANYQVAHRQAATHASKDEHGHTPYHPWPETLTDYLRERLNEEYKIFYYVLDRDQFDDNLCEVAGYVPQPLGDSTESGGNILKTLLKVDFLHAQRHLSDGEAKGRAEDLSRRLSRFYEHNLKKYDVDFSALKALAQSETGFNDHLAAVFQPTLDKLNQLGYPGFANPDLVIKSALKPESILSQHASVHYALRDPGNPKTSKPYPTLPDNYNGLGFKNLIYMVIEVLDFHQRWVDQEDDRSLLHLIIIEEPEAHMHAQLQQVFIQRIMDLLPPESPTYRSQLIVTTHSTHIVYESGFTPIRYFRRTSPSTGANQSIVLNLSDCTASHTETREFLLQYMKLTHCDLFFADAAIMVEGNVERLLLPLMIEKEALPLKSRYLTILELGGAFAHVFKDLVQLLGIPTLIITDLDSVQPKVAIDGKLTAKGSDPCAQVAAHESEEDSDETGSTKCLTTEPNAVTSNQTLVQWLPKLTTVSDLLAATDDQKILPMTEDCPATVRVSYQTRVQVTWDGQEAELAGRTFEEAFAFENLAWCQDICRKQLHLRVVSQKQPGPPLQDVIKRIHTRVKGDSFNKTEFALALMMQKQSEWVVPSYIKEGLQWLSVLLTSTEAVDSIAPEPGEME